MRGALLVVLAAALVTAGCGGSDEGLPETQAGPGTRSGDVALRDLTGVDQLRAAFNRDQGSPRLLLLLSPT